MSQNTFVGVDIVARAHQAPGRCVRTAALIAIAFICHTSDARGDLRDQIRERGLDPSSIVMPFELDAEMRAWVREEVQTAGEPERRLDQLLRAILHRDGKDLTYQRGYTATAREVWRSHRANCLSFAHLYVGLAREIGLRVYYLRVYDIQNFEKDGDLVVASEHITAAYGPSSRRQILEFTDRPFKEYREKEMISDLTAVALYYSNMGAHRIREGQFQEAEGLLKTAVRLDPELGDAWVNLGVASRRLGDVREAEAAFRRALEVNPSLLAAYNNLAALLDRQGRDAEAHALLALTDRRSNRNPFSYLALGDLALSQGNLPDAERFFRRAQRIEPDHVETLAALGQWALAAGRRREAERWLEKAEAINPAEARVRDLAQRLYGPIPRNLTSSR